MIMQKYKILRAVILITSLFSGRVFADSYLLLNFETTLETEIPKWLGITRSFISPRTSVDAWSIGKGTHLEIDAGLTVISFRPKQYYLHHFDFSHDFNDDSSSIKLPTPKRIRIRKNTIHYFGDVYFKNDVATFEINMETLNTACLKYQKLFAQNSVLIHMPDGKRKEYPNKCH
jgi:hypothetical protein